MGRILVLIYGVVCYAIFLLTFLYAIGFIGNIYVPKSMDSPASGNLGPALLVNIVLLTIFAVQHSVMARPAFKKQWTKIIPAAAERSTYVLTSSLALILLFYYWQPLGGSIWNLSGTLAGTLLWVGFFFGWGLVLFATFLINHFDLFGLRHVWLYYNKKEYTHSEFTTPGLYKYIRHPLYLGWFFAFWCTPTMTMAHLLFAVVTTAYILVAIRWEEKDLKTSHSAYADYTRQVPMIFPTGKKYQAPVFTDHVTFKDEDR